MPDFTQRHYKQIAASLNVELRRAPGPEARVIIGNIAAEFARMFRVDNDLFQPFRFYKACGFTEQEQHPNGSFRS